MMTRPGMTLVETLVGLVVLGLVAALGLSTLNLIGQAGKVAAADQGALAAVQDLLRLRLVGAMPLIGIGPGGQPAVLFQGNPDRVAFVTELPARFGVAGPALVEVRREEEGLRLLWRPLTGHAGGEGLQGRLLIDRAAELRLRYFGTPRGPEAPAWRDLWSDAARLPAAIEMRVSFANDDTRRWPPMIVAPRLASLREERAE
ncbi:prepilin-type N-terminal cleavage/methylation domain-containing protein [Roseomonas populi]|uniref:Prepilin-type N-terminal cleavage/methylation domain-containing protein n=1 Tax=Roseomonas populi TaxID=3121582 RepID=A0ABT1X941_9PROT|nr:prepilin-type N-terminal cleavage/methylation domain-containing protein [Roseomonas pecuniae]MCR0983642.1 prepilin-type N-terminal cleavage/methylation domain-containing protein [Roseomonas pecuniae]